MKYPTKGKNPQVVKIAMRNSSLMKRYSMIRGVPKKSGPLCLNSEYSANSRPIWVYYIPNQWKFNEDFAALYRFEIAALRPKIQSN